MGKDLNEKQRLSEDEMEINPSPLPKRTTEEIQNAFLNFFESREHKIFPESSLIPQGDASILFTNAGMNQFKDFFLGLKSAPFDAMTTAQWCLRAGGKHNDLENVGYTARHHTLFKMLGNFSFGKYSKKEAIDLAWTFLTDSIHGLGLSPDRLWATVYAEDTEAFKIWTGVHGFVLDHLVVIGDNLGGRHHSDNFWQMGETGPCGPCSEIFYDYGPEYEGTPPGPNQTGERFIEIWNLVFMQYMQQASGVVSELPRLCIDTGMGLERISAVMQSKHDNYQTELFKKLIQIISVELQVDNDPHNFSLRVIADHCRAIYLLLDANVAPSNQGRGYVLRRIIRRAMVHAYKLGADRAIIFKMIRPFSEVMLPLYSHRLKRIEDLENILYQEECAFLQTLDYGFHLLKEKLSKHNPLEKFPGAVAFQLYDTYGFPLDITANLCQDAGVSIDLEAYEQCLDNQKKRSQAHKNFSSKNDSGISELALSEYPDSIFLGYERMDSFATVCALFDAHENSAPILKPFCEGYVVLDETVFYPEGGGQAGDQGSLSWGDFGHFEVTSTQKINNKIIHKGVLRSESLKVGDSVHSKINKELRAALSCHHSATHLLHRALLEVCGSSVRQAGSSIHAEDFRFDFEYDRALSLEQIHQVEDLVNRYIQNCIPVQTHVFTKDQAKKELACMFFQEKYSEKVRMVEIGNVSKELCCGTHVSNTGQIGYFRILSENGLSKNIRRIQAAASFAAISNARFALNVVTSLSNHFKCQTSQLNSRIKQIEDERHKLCKSVSIWKFESAQFLLRTIENKCEETAQKKFFCWLLKRYDSEFLREVSKNSKFSTQECIAFVSAYDATIYVFCLFPFKNTKLAEKIAHFLSAYGTLQGGGPSSFKDWRVLGSSFQSERLLQKLNTFLSQIFS